MHTVIRLSGPILRSISQQRSRTVPPFEQIELSEQDADELLEAPCYWSRKSLELHKDPENIQTGSEVTDSWVYEPLVCESTVVTADRKHSCNVQIAIRYPHIHVNGVTVCRHLFEITDHKSMVFGEYVLSRGYGFLATAMRQRLLLVSVQLIFGATLSQISSS